MRADALGDRMKKYYEDRSKTYLTRRTPVIIRIDGCHFHTYTAHFDRPFDKVFIKTMQETTKALCENIQGCKLGYVESDEISLLLTDYDTISTDAWFDYSVQKICSVSASMATMFFNRFFEKNALEFESNQNSQAPQTSLLNAYDTAKRVGAYFDARAFNLPESEITNYFLWRELDASRNSIQGLGHKYFSQKELESKNNSEIQEMLHEEKGINWNDCSVVEKRGSCVKRVVENDVSMWKIDENIPIFSKDRSYIESIIEQINASCEADFLTRKSENEKNKGDTK